MVANAIAIDGSGNAYVAGDGGGPGFPSTPGGLRADAGEGGAAVVKLNPTGSRLAYTALFGGMFGDSAAGIAVDGSGNAVVVGTVDAGGSPTGPAFPTANASQPTRFKGVEGQADGAAAGHGRGLGVRGSPPSGPRRTPGDEGRSPGAGEERNTPIVRPLTPRGAEGQAGTGQPVGRKPQHARPRIPLGPDGRGIE
jgi:hypothetical protein